MQDPLTSNITKLTGAGEHRSAFGPSAVAIAVTLNEALLALLAIGRAGQALDFSSDRAE